MCSETCHNKDHVSVKKDRLSIIKDHSICQVYEPLNLYYLFVEAMRAFVVPVNGLYTCTGFTVYMRARVNGGKDQDHIRHVVQIFNC